MLKDGDLSNKHYVVDSSAIIDTPGIIEKLGKSDKTGKEDDLPNTVVVPWCTTNRIEKVAKDSKRLDLCLSAKQAVNYIFELTRELKAKGMRNQDGSYVLESGARLIFDSYSSNKENGDAILSFLDNYKSKLESEKDPEIILITQDKMLMVKAEIKGFKAEPIASSATDEVHSGVEYFLVDDPRNLGELVDSIYKDDGTPAWSEIDIKKLRDSYNIELDSKRLYPNVGCVLQTPNGHKMALLIYKTTRWIDKDNVVTDEENIVDSMPYFSIAALPQKRRTDKIVPINIEQSFALSHINDRTVRVLTITGAAGSGKTKLPLWQYVYNRKNNLTTGLYAPSMTVFRSRVEELEEGTENYGALPGGKEEKMAEHANPIFKALDHIYKMLHINKNTLFKKVPLSGATEKPTSSVDESGNKQEKSRSGRPWEEKEKSDRPIDEMLSIAVEPINFIQGATLDDTVALFDEAQQMNIPNLYMGGTRLGNNAKAIFTGDTSHQRSARNIFVGACALTVLIKRVKTNKYCAHITLQETVRSLSANIFRGAFEPILKLFYK